MKNLDVSDLSKTLISPSIFDVIPVLKRKGEKIRFRERTSFV